MNNSEEPVNGNDRRRYFTIIPNMIDDMDLTPYARVLYLHLKRVAGESGACWEGVRTMAQRCHMSADAVIAAKRELAKAGLITIQKRPNRESDVITITDVWDMNRTLYENSSGAENRTEPAPDNDATPAIAEVFDISSTVFDMSNESRTIKKNNNINSAREAPACAGAPEGARDRSSFEREGGVGGASHPQRATAPAAPYAALMRSDDAGDRWRWLRHEQRPLAQAFLTAAGERYYPRDESLRKLWRREINRWIAAGVDGRALSETVDRMRRQGLAITGPQSVTGMAINYLEQRRAAQEEFPLFIAREAEWISYITKVQNKP